MEQEGRGMIAHLIHFGLIFVASLCGYLTGYVILIAWAKMVWKRRNRVQG